jgi:nucleoside-diphosphate-sugar epimerase
VRSTSTCTWTNRSVADLKSLGAEPHILSLEDASEAELAQLLADQRPDATIFAAGAGGKGGPERTRAVDYDGALKVYAACEAAGARRFLLVSAIDVRDRAKPVPAWYTPESKEASDAVWKAIGTCE